MKTSEILLLDFAKTASYNLWKENKHLKLLIKYLTNLEGRKIKRLIVNMPP